MKVSVKQQHIQDGKPGEPCKCPIALAVKVPNVTRVSVGTRLLTLWLANATSGFDYKQFRLSEPAVKFIEAFDKGLPVKPSTFIFKRIKPVVR